ncbi:unnamed protein product [Mytilus coruscus]|uniref:BIRC7_8 n=1 Tax=Mytilus coruscus TaxID=42192 RepID=A0A6J8DEN8_MYTCO|nr:unnamed protein product [Mytilus coruscus]
MHKVDEDNHVPLKMKENSFKNSDGDDTLGVCLKKPLNNGYTTVASRLRSFQCWSRPSPRPVDLSEAGFYYTGTEDVVQCFYCGLKLKSWDVFDDPWIENDGLNEKSKKTNLYTDDLLHTTAAQALVSMGYYKEQQIKDAIRTYVSKEDTLEKPKIPRKKSKIFSSLTKLCTIKRRTTVSDITPYIHKQRQINGHHAIYHKWRQINGHDQRPRINVKGVINGIGTPNENEQGGYEESCRKKINKTDTNEDGICCRVGCGMWNDWYDCGCCHSDNMSDLPEAKTSHMSITLWI